MSNGFSVLLQTKQIVYQKYYGFFKLMGLTQTEFGMLD